MKQTFTVRDEVGGKTIEVVVADNNGMLYVAPKGYGDKTSADGEGAPIVLSLFNNRLALFVWDDINQEEVSHEIDLENAQENMRKPEKT